MKLKGNTVLITGGSSGIGYELAQQLIELGNKVIICGRSIDKLETARKNTPRLHIYKCDVSEASERLKLGTYIHRFFPECNVVINNAALVHKGNFFQLSDMLNKTELEVNTNLIAPIALTHILFPIVSRNPNSSFIYMTSGLAYVPKIAYPIYSSTKAALHSFIQTTRYQTKETQLIEIILPVVDTPFHKGATPKSAITPSKCCTRNDTKD